MRLVATYCPVHGRPHSPDRCRACAEEARLLTEHLRASRRRRQAGAAIAGLVAAMVGLTAWVAWLAAKGA